MEKSKAAEAAAPEKEKSTFERMASIDVGPHIEKKNGLSYLSWAWALDQLMRQDPDADWSYPDPTVYDDGTMMVHCVVEAFGKSRKAHLPVMDHRNKPISKPDAFQINTAMQRCLVKAIALHGLGLYIYAGEDLPYDEAKVAEALESGSGKPMADKAFQQWKERIEQSPDIEALKDTWCGLQSTLKEFSLPADRIAELTKVTDDRKAIITQMAELAAKSDAHKAAIKADEIPQTFMGG